MDANDLEKKKLEYRAAQEMLRHYDLLNWLIGTALVVACVLLTGLLLRQDFIALLRSEGAAGWLLVLLIPAFSFFLLGVWLLWFRRHRDLYNFRNETLHRLETQMGLYHYLRVVEADCGLDEDKTRRLNAARIRAGHTGGEFVPFYAPRLSKPSGYMLAKALAFGIPVFQLLIFIAVKCG